MPLDKKNSFYQKLKFPVNTFPGKLEVEIDGKKLVPGIDYLVDAGSGKSRGAFSIFGIAGANFRGSPDTLKNKFLLIDKSLVKGAEEKSAMDLWITDAHGAKGVIIPEDVKLTWTVSRKKYRHTVLRILRKSLPENPKKITVHIESRFCRKYRTQNIAGMIKGTQFPDSFIVFSAHYDHLGRMGRDTYFPGANDNASGISMLLNLAKHYSQNPPECSMLFIAFAGEEAGLMGSEFFVKHPLVPLHQIKFLLNMDLLGTGDEGMMVVNGEVFPDLFSKMDSINLQNNLIASLQKRGKARNSDHYWFTEKNVPSFFIYTMGGIKAYHDIFDKAETLPLTDYSDVFRLIIKFIDEL